MGNPYFCESVRMSAGRRLNFNLVSAQRIRARTKPDFVAPISLDIADSLACSRRVIGIVTRMNFPGSDGTAAALPDDLVASLTRTSAVEKFMPRPTGADVRPAVGETPGVDHAPSPERMSRRKTLGGIPPIPDEPDAPMWAVCHSATEHAIGTRITSPHTHPYT